MNALCKLGETYAPLLGRILISFVFLQSGYDKVLNFVKNLTLMGAMLRVIGVGSGPLSLHRRTGRPEG